MAEVIGILSAISTAQQVLWDFSRLVRRYRHLPERVLDLEENLHACKVTLEVWKSRWSIRQGRSNVYYEVLWSKRGWKAIQTCLSSIKILCNLVQDDINRLVGSALHYQGYSRNERYNGRYDGQVMRRALDRINRRMSRRRRFFWAVVLKADDLDYQLDRFNTKLINLERFAEAYLLDTHPTLYSKDSSAFQQEAQHLVQDGEKGEMRRIVRGVREDAGSIHKAWVGENEMQCHLAIARTSSQVDRDPMLEKHLYFVLSNNDRPTEVRLKPVTFEDRDEMQRLPDTLTDAFHSVATSSKRCGDLLPPGATDGSGFEVHINRKSSLVRLDQTSPLNALIKKGQTDPTCALTNKDKIIAASSLVQGCYRFLGSPWLNYLDTSNLRGQKDGSGAWIGMLSAQMGNRFVNRALVQFSSNPSYQKFNLDQHKQLFRLGITLTELAVGSIVSYAEASDDISVPGVSIVLPELADDEKLDADEIASEVEKRTGSQLYSNVVRFCLSSLQSRGKIKAQLTDEAVETELLEPAKALAKFTAQ